ncbi:MAG: hypothetical protein EXR69_02675 [Myxococcales bacterium]|nr:hypothetical protein [Myxococcales bacterium]
MEGTGITMAQASMRSIVHQLRDGDVVSVVTWSTRTNTVIDGLTVSGPDDPSLLDAVDGLTSTPQNCGGDEAAAFHFGVMSTAADGTQTATVLDTNVATMTATGPTQVVKAVALVNVATAMDGVWAVPSADRKAYLEAARDRMKVAADTLADDGDLPEVVNLLSAYAGMF